MNRLRCSCLFIGPVLAGGLLPILDGKVDAASEGDRHCRAGLGLYRHRPFLVRATEDRGLFAVTGDDPHPLVELAGDVLPQQTLRWREQDSNPYGAFPVK